MASPHRDCCNMSLSGFVLVLFNFIIFFLFLEICLLFLFFLTLKNVFHTCLWKPKVKLLCFIKGTVMMPGEKEACWLL